MNGKGKLVLQTVKSAQPVHRIPGAYVGAPAERFQPAAVLIFHQQIAAETGCIQVGSNAGSAGRPLGYQAVYFCLIFSTHSRQKTIFLNRCQDKV